MAKKKKLSKRAEAELQQHAEEMTAVAVALIKGAAPHIDEEDAYDILFPYIAGGFTGLDEVIAVSSHIVSGVHSGTVQ